jgi:hypothetical protein
MLTHTHSPTLSDHDRKIDREIQAVIGAIMSMCFGSLLGICVLIFLMGWLPDYIKRNNIRTFEEMPYFFQYTVKLFEFLYLIPERVSDVYHVIPSPAKLCYIKNKKTLIEKEIILLKLTDKLETIKIDDQLLCPITGALMRDPVFNAAGQTYERHALEKWYRKHNTDPFSGQKLTEKQKLIILPNRGKEGEILRFLRNTAAQVSTSKPATASQIVARPSSIVQEHLQERTRKTRDAFLRAYEKRNAAAAQDVAQQQDLEAADTTVRTSLLPT